MTARRPAAAGANPMRIGIVSAAPMVAEMLRRILSATPEHRVAWTVATGEEAVALCHQDLPDLVLLDLLLPGMDGVEATRRIMAETPCPILLVTASVDANVPRVFEAMGYGAMDAMDTPALGPGDPPQGAAALLRKIAAIRQLVGGRAGAAAARRAEPVPLPGHPLVAIGASAGGPAALATLLRGLPRDFPAALVIVQHLDERFVPGMAEWLGGHAAMPVRMARENETPPPGTILIAAREAHLTLRPDFQLDYTSEPRTSVYRPSIDVFFHSVAQFWKGSGAAVLLTGMGGDGALGLKALRDRGWPTIAQDRATSAVYGMPKAAAEIGAASEILPLARIAPRLISVTSRPSSQEVRP